MLDRHAVQAFLKAGQSPRQIAHHPGSRAARGIGRPGLSIVVHEQVRAWIMDDPTVPRPPREYGPRPPRPRGDVGVRGRPIEASPRSQPDPAHPPGPPAERPARHTGAVAVAPTP